MNANACLLVDAVFLDQLRSNEFASLAKPKSYEISVEDLQRQYAINQSQMDELPINISSYTETSRSLDDKGKPANNVGAAINLDLSLWTLATKQKLLSRQQERLDLSLKAIEVSNKQQVYSDLLTFGASQQLIHIFNQRAQWLEMQRNFLEIEEKNGVNRLQEIIESEIKSNELINKRLGAEASIERSLLSLELGEDQVPELDLDLTESSNIDHRACEQRELQLQVADIDVDIANLQSKLSQQKDGITLTSSLSVLSDTETKPQSMAGLKLSVPIYSGGSNSSRDLELERGIIKAQDARDQISLDLAKARRERETLNKLTSRSIELIERRISEGERLLAELDERRKLGQSTFNEIITRQIELSVQYEALIRLRKDYYQSIIDYSALMGHL
ncbi:TolC family protein [Marinobacterium sp. xm-d-530]|uniref:TolC family protein n=1 Tax=Marinobacterium sp. xm-d-530 TaxID=2497747 RepID=UPI00156A4065|nr:TolC family protein [Marinobacterium sp. xm-d-530]